MLMSAGLASVLLRDAQLHSMLESKGLTDRHLPCKSFI